MAKEFVPCDRSVCTSAAELAGAGAIDANIETELCQVALVQNTRLERLKAIYEEDRDRLGLDEAEVLAAYYRMREDQAAVNRAEQIARAWHNSQVEAATRVNAIDCEAVGTVDCPRLQAALGSIADRFAQVSLVEADPDTSA